MDYFRAMIDEGVGLNIVTIAINMELYISLRGFSVKTNMDFDVFVANAWKMGTHVTLFNMMDTTYQGHFVGRYRAS